MNDLVCFLVGSVAIVVVGIIIMTCGGKKVAEEFTEKVKEEWAARQAAKEKRQDEATDLVADLVTGIWKKKT